MGWRAGSLTDAQKRVRDQLQRLSMVGSRDPVDKDSCATAGSEHHVRRPDAPGAGLARDLELLLYQAGVEMRVGTFVIVLLVIGAVVLLLFQILFGRPLFALFLGIVCGFIPYMVVKAKRTKRTHRSKSSSRTPWTS